MRALEKTFLLNRNFFPADGLRVTLTNKKEKLLSEGTGSGGGGANKSEGRFKSRRGDAY